MNELLKSKDVGKILGMTSRQVIDLRKKSYGPRPFAKDATGHALYHLEDVLAYKRQLDARRPKKRTEESNILSSRGHFLIDPAFGTRLYSHAPRSPQTASWPPLLILRGDPVMNEELPDCVVFTPEQAAAYLGKTKRQLKRWRANGTGPVWCRESYKCVRYLKADLDAWMNGQRVVLEIEDGA